MAEMDDPYAKYLVPAAPAGDDPYAKYVKKEVKDPTIGEYAEDAAKTALPSLARGAISVAGTGGDLQEIAKIVGPGGYNPFGWISDKLGNTKLGSYLSEKAGQAFDAVGGPQAVQGLKNESEKTLKGPLARGVAASGDMMGGGNIELPTSAGLKKSLEDNVTGPLYEAKYGPGKALQTTLEVAPALATGPVGGAKGLVAKSVGAGVLSELAGEGAEATKHLLPEKAQPWAEPVARGAGTVAGMFTPAGARKIVTPLPMTDEQHRVVQALKKSDPDFVKTASTGQLTESPRMMGMEARSFPDQAEKQGKAFTEATMARGEDTGKKIGNIYDTNVITSAEFPILNTEVAQAKRALGGITGATTANNVLGEIQKDIRLGAANSPQTLNMTGKRYQYLRDKVQGAIDGEGNNTVKNALVKVKTSLDDAFNRSLPDGGTELANLRQQKHTHSVLADRTPTLDKQVTPESVLSAAAHGEGNRTVNSDKSPLANWARDADRIMTPHPKPSENAPAWFDLLSTMGGALTHGGAAAGGGHAMGGIPGALMGGSLGGAEGGVLGHLLKDSLYKILASGGSKAVSNAPAQKFLGNQAWRPGAASTTDMNQLVRLLMSPEVKPQ